MYVLLIFLAIWDVLSNESTNLEYLRRTIILPNEGVHALNSVTDQKFLRLMGTPLILHGKTIRRNHLHYICQRAAKCHGHRDAKSGEVLPGCLFPERSVQEHHKRPERNLAI